VLDLAKDCTYLLTADIDGNGLPAITAPITLNGGKNTTIERAAAVDEFRILAVDTGGNLTLNKLTITGGQVTGDGAGVLVNAGGALTTKDSTITRNIAESGDGGGIFNAGTTVVTNSSVSRNTVDQIGGGIYSTGRLDIVKSQVDNNIAVNTGGVFAQGLTMKEGSISRNQALTVGGLFVVGGVGTVVGTRVTGNTAIVVGGIAAANGAQLRLRHLHLTADSAGGLFVRGGVAVAESSAVIEDSLIMRNTATSVNGGGILNEGQLVLRRTKVTENQADQGGGIYNEAIGTTSLFSTKIVKNIAVTDGGGIFNDGGTVNLNTATGTIVVKNRPNNCVNVSGCSG